jgi:hypothetical protein
MLLVLPANVRLDWKVIARYKHSSLFGLIISNEGNKFYNIDTRLVTGNSRDIGQGQNICLINETVRYQTEMKPKF